MSKHWGRVFWLLAAVGLLVFLWIALATSSRVLPSTLLDKPLPDFKLPALVKVMAPVRSQALRGQVWLLNVWASWCRNCALEHPILMDIAHAKMVAIVGLDYKDRRVAAQTVLKTAGDPYTQIAFDALGRVSLNLGVYGTPETFVIDQRGRVRAKHIGPLTQVYWQTELLPLIKRLQAEEIG